MAACSVHDDYDEEELRASLLDTEEDVDREVAELLRGILSKATEILGDDDDAATPSPEEVAWAAKLEATAASVVELMASRLEELRRGVTVFAGEEAFVEALREQATSAEAQRAAAEDIVSAVRRVQEKELRWLVKREDLVDPAEAEFLRYVSEAMESELDDGKKIPSAEEVTEAASSEGAAVSFEEKMAGLACKLRRGVAAFTGRPGEEELVRALQKQAASAEAVRAAAQAFVAALRHYQAVAASANPAASPEHRPETEDSAGAGAGAGARKRRRLSESDSPEAEQRLVFHRSIPL